MNKIVISDGSDQDVLEQFATFAAKHLWQRETVSLSNFSITGREKWIATVSDWLDEHCKGGWAGLARHDYGNLVLDFELPADAEVFKAAHREREF